MNERRPSVSEDSAEIENIAEKFGEKIDSMGRAEKRELVNRLTVLPLLLLKWRFQPLFRGNR